MPESHIPSYIWTKFPKSMHNYTLTLILVHPLDWSKCANFEQIWLRNSCINFGNITRNMTIRHMCKLTLPFEIIDGKNFTALFYFLNLKVSTPIFQFYCVLDPQIWGRRQDRGLILVSLELSPYIFTGRSAFSSIGPVSSSHPWFQTAKLIYTYAW